MQQLTKFFEPIWQPFTLVTNPSERLYWPYLLASLLVALFYIWRTTNTGSTFLFSKKLWLHQSAKLDYKLLFVKSILRSFWIVPSALSALGLTIWLVRLLTRTFGTAPHIAMGDTSIIMIYTVTLFVLWDGSRYLVHRLLHQIPCLWELHQVHHSAEVLTPVTLYRSHPIESAIYYLRGIIVTGVVTSFFFYWFEDRAIQYQLLGINIFGFLFNALGSNLRHSPIWISYGNTIEKLFISPAQHQIHHSCNSHHHNKNFGSWLAVWDRMGGSLATAKGNKPTSFGMSDSQRNHDPHRASSALVDPLVSSLRAVGKTVRRHVLRHNL